MQKKWNYISYHWLFLMNLFWQLIFAHSFLSILFWNGLSNWHQDHTRVFYHSENWIIFLDPSYQSHLHSFQWLLNLVLDILSFCTLIIILSWKCSDMIWGGKGVRNCEWSHYCLTYTGISTASCLPPTFSVR
jgi:hypothetical protein